MLHAMCAVTARPRQAAVSSRRRSMKKRAGMVLMISHAIRKKRVYHRHAVGHYWIVDPDQETLAVYRSHAEGYVEILIADRDERVRADPFDAIEFCVGMLFGDDDDE
jgi:hypothetical protein